MREIARTRTRLCVQEKERKRERERARALECGSSQVSSTDPERIFEWRAQIAAGSSAANRPRFQGAQSLRVDTCGSVYVTYIYAGKSERTRDCAQAQVHVHARGRERERQDKGPLIRVLIQVRLLTTFKFTSRVDIRVEHGGAGSPRN